jgi:hypothetical protein
MSAVTLSSPIPSDAINCILISSLGFSLEASRYGILKQENGCGTCGEMERRLALETAVAKLMGLSHYS